MNEPEFDYDLDGTYVCVYCDNDCTDVGCDVCHEYKGVMTLREYDAYQHKVSVYVYTFMGA